MKTGDIDDVSAHGGIRTSEASSSTVACRRLKWPGVLLALAVAAANPVAVAAVGPAEPAHTTPRVAIASAGQSLSIQVDEVVGLGDLAAEIADRIGAELILRRDPGTIGPVRIAGLAPAEAFRRLAGRHSLVLHYRDGRIVRVTLIAAREGTTAAPRSVVAKAVHKAAPVLDLPRAPGLDARNQRATTIRDIVKLSYRHDDEAVAELAAIVATSVDPAVRGAAISALAGVGGNKAARLIATSGLVDHDPQVRLRAAHGLWLASGADAGARLRSAAKREPDPEARVAIERLLRDGPPRGGGGQGAPHPARPTR